MCVLVSQLALDTQGFQVFFHIMTAKNKAIFCTLNQLPMKPGELLRYQNGSQQNRIKKVEVFWVVGDSGCSTDTLTPNVGECYGCQSVEKITSWEGYFQSLWCLWVVRSLWQLQKLKDAIAQHNTDRCSLGPPLGVSNIDFSKPASSSTSDQPAKVAWWHDSKFFLCPMTHYCVTKACHVSH